MCVLDTNISVPAHLLHSITSVLSRPHFASLSLYQNFPITSSLILHRNFVANWFESFPFLCCLTGHKPWISLLCYLVIYKCLSFAVIFNDLMSLKRSDAILCGIHFQRSFPTCLAAQELSTNFYFYAFRQWPLFRRYLCQRVPLSRVLQIFSKLASMKSNRPQLAEEIMLSLRKEGIKSLKMRLVSRKFKNSFVIRTSIYLISVFFFEYIVWKSFALYSACTIINDDISKSPWTV